MGRKQKPQRKAARQPDQRGVKMAARASVRLMKVAADMQRASVNLQALLDHPAPLKPTEVATVFRVSPAHIRRRIHAGEIPSIWIGSHMMIPHAWFKAKLTGNYKDGIKRPSGSHTHMRGRWSRAAKQRAMAEAMAE